MKLIFCNIILVIVVLAIPTWSESIPEPTSDTFAGSYSDPDARAFANPNANPFAMPSVNAEVNPETYSNVLSSMFQRGENLMRQFLPTGFTISGMVGRFFPTPQNIFKLTKHLLFELPQEIVLYAIQAFCTSAISNNVLNPQDLPNMAEMNFVFKTVNGEVTARLDESEKIWSHPEFKASWNTVMVITGWNSNVNESKLNFALEALWSAYKTRNVNFVYFDTAKFVDTLYTWSAFNTKGLGDIIGQALVKFVRFVPIERIHLIGHSLGAHICGFAGRAFTNATDQYIARITGLDPARPCFNQGQSLDGLSRGDAAFVDIIHSNAGALGKKTTIGDVDFWPNGHSSLQPGCFTLLCSHSRSFEYYAESVIRGNERNFMAVRCNSYTAYKDGLCDGKPVPMGLLTPPTAKGDYYLTTRARAPFGLKTSSYNALAVNNSDIVQPINFEN